MINNGEDKYYICKWEFHQQNMADLGLSTYVLVNQWSEKCSLNHCHIIFCPDKMIKNTISIKLFIKVQRLLHRKWKLSRSKFLVNNRNFFVKSQQHEFCDESLIWSSTVYFIENSKWKQMSEFWNFSNTRLGKWLLNLVCQCSVVCIPCC